MKQTKLRHEAEARKAINDWYNVALTTLEVPYEARYVETRFGRTHLLVTGNPEGEPLIMLHGMNLNSLVWRPQFPALQHYRVYAVDIIGQPGRSDLNRPSLVGGDYARWLLEVLDALALETVSVVGLSLGAYIAIKFGAFAPERVKGAVLIAPAGLSPVRPTIGLRLASTHLPIPFRSHEKAANNLIPTIVMTPGVEVDGMGMDMLELFRIMHRYEKPVRGPFQSVEAILPGLPVLALEARRFDKPTMVLIGDKDALFDAKLTMERAKHVLPGLVAVEIIPDAGHAMNFEYPHTINGWILRFLETMLETESSTYAG